MNPLTLAQMAPEGPSPLLSALPFIAIGAIFYFFIVMPQTKREKEKESMRQNLKKSDEVVFAGGLLGRIADLKGPILSVEVAPNVRVRVERRAVEALAPKPAKAED